MTEIEVDTHKARKEWSHKAEESEKHVIEKMEEVKGCAKTMMKDAKHQVEDYQKEKEKEKTTGCFGKIVETFKGSSRTEVSH